MFPNNIVQTKQIKKFFELCQMIRREKYLGLVYGPPGSGKSVAAMVYAKVDKQKVYDWTSSFMPPKIFYTVAKVVSTTKDIAYTVVREKAGNGRIYFSTMKVSFDHFISLEESRPELILLDEADRLKKDTLEFIRDVYDKTQCPFLFIGMPGLDRKFSRYPQLYSRIGFVQGYAPMSFEETWHLITVQSKALGVKLDQKDFTDLEMGKEIFRITHGNLRLLMRLLSQVKRLMEINNRSCITKELVEAASQLLILGSD
jgi:DNA transposition AAA+ family ATPase